MDGLIGHFELVLMRNPGLGTVAVSRRCFAPTPFKSAKANPTQINAGSESDQQPEARHCEFRYFWFAQL